MMRVGLDFDNTIVCYDGLFHRLALERDLIPADLPATKSHVRDYLRRVGREPDWTELQGVAYGPRLVDANPFPGVKDFLAGCRQRGVECVIISHKTRHPYLGPAYDLHDAAQQFLQSHGFYETNITGLSPASVNLELTKEAKLERIGLLDCDFFIDDLPEFLGEAAFPQRTQRILFDPAEACADESFYWRVPSWDRVADIVRGQGGTA